MLYALITDLIFRSKVREATSGQVCFIASQEELHSKLSAASEIQPPLLVDLQAKSPDPFELIALARKLHPAIQIVCFYSHVQPELAKRAQAAGASEVVTRSRFEERLVSLVSSQPGTKRVTI